MMKKFYILSMLLFVGTAHGLAQNKTDRDYLRSGNKLYNDSLFIKAEVDYRKALECYDNKDYDNEKYGVVLSAVCTSYIQELADATRNSVEKYFNISVVNNYNSCLAYVPRKAPAYYDMNSVMKKFLAVDEYESWKAVFDKAIPYIMVSN